MGLQPVQSSAIAAIDYNQEAGTLDIVFIEKRRHYRYADVPMEVWLAFSNYDQHGSYGRFFKNHIQGKYDYRELTSGGK